MRFILVKVLLSVIMLFVLTSNSYASNSYETASGTCKTHPNLCSEAALCVQATTWSNGKRVWGTSIKLAKYAKEAQSRELSCGVKTASSSSSSSMGSCYTNIKLCTPEALCDLGTSYKNGKRDWTTKYNFSKYVKEAKTRGLTCGIATASSSSSGATCHTSAKACSNSNLCIKARIKNNDGAYIWDNKQLYKKYVKEAKIRGLTCNVKAASATGWCGSNPKKCINTDLCSRATYTSSGQKYWTTVPSRTKYVKESKIRGLTCNVKAASATGWCGSNPKKCINTDLCSRATYTSSGQKYWTTVPSRTKYVKESKIRGLTCGVTTASSSSSATIVKNLTDSNLCWKARIYKNGKYHWRTSYKQLKYVKEANSRGLSCGVNITTAKTCNDDPTLCTVAQLCVKASHYSGGKKAWRKSYTAKKYVTEAKKNGVTCSVKVKVAKVDGCNEDPTRCTVAQLCTKASHYSGGKKAWRKDYSSKKYVTEAKKNGLPCGVTDEIYKPTTDKHWIASSGSGFFITKDGHIVTNYHVIEGCDHMTVSYMNEQLSSKVIAFDKIHDLGLLRIKNKPKVVYSLTNKRPFLGQEIKAAGYPDPKKLGTNVKITKGIVSSLANYEGDPSEFQMDAVIHGGNSGGPIFDDYGNVMGVSVSGYKQLQAVNYGIKASMVRAFLDSYGVNLLPPNKKHIDKLKFSDELKYGTVLLECWKKYGSN